jgi:hypothetical protein
VKKEILYPIIGTAIFLGLAGFLLYRSGKKAGKGEKPSIIVPEAQGQVESNETITALANSLYQDMNGLNWLGHTNKYYEQAMQLNDVDLLRLYDAFNSAYQPESKQTLTEWLDNEGAFSEPQFAEVANQLIDRLRKLKAV